MPFSQSLLFTPFFWFFFSAVATGAALSRATRRTKLHSDQATTRKWTLVSIYLSIAVVLATCGVFVPGAEKVKDVAVLHLFGVTFAASFLALRFKRAIGLPITLILLFALILGLLFFQSVRAFTGETEIARIRVLSSTGDNMKLEVLPVVEQRRAPEPIGLKSSDEASSGQWPVIVSLEGQYFAPIVKVIIFDDLYVFLGSKTWYRFEGLTSFRMEKTEDGFRLRQSDTDFYFEQPEGVSEWIYDLFERHERFIPGIKSVQVELDLKRVFEIGSTSGSELSAFSVRVQNDGGVQIVQIN